MKRRALHERMSQRRRCVASRFKLQTNTVSLFLYQWVYSTGQQKEKDGKPLECDKRDGAITCVFCREFTQHGFFALLQKICLKECEVWRKVFSNKIIVTLFTQGLPSSFPFRPLATTTTLNPLDLKEFSFNQRGQSLFKWPSSAQPSKPWFPSIHQLLHCTCLGFSKNNALKSLKKLHQTFSAASNCRLVASSWFLVSSCRLRSSLKSSSVFSSLLCSYECSRQSSR